MSSMKIALCLIVMLGVVAVSSAADVTAEAKPDVISKLLSDPKTVQEALTCGMDHSMSSCAPLVKKGSSLLTAVYQQGVPAMLKIFNLIANKFWPMIKVVMMTQMQGLFGDSD